MTETKLPIPEVNLTKGEIRHLIKTLKKAAKALEEKIGEQVLEVI